MRFAAPTNCHPDLDNCDYHQPCEMMQIFSLTLAKASINSGLIQLYGYIAARDNVDSKLNYVFNRSRDDPIIVQQVQIVVKHMHVRDEFETCVFLLAYYNQLISSEL